MYHCSATLFITSGANSMNSFPFFFFWMVTSKGFGEGWMISRCCDSRVLCWCLQVEPQQTQSGNNHTDTSNKLLVTMPKFPETETLIKCVGSQTRWREAIQACMCFNTWQEFSPGDERWGLAPHFIHIQQKSLWWHSSFDGKTECVSLHRFKGSVLSQLMAVCSAVSNVD